MQWAFAISPVTALLSHWTKEHKPLLPNNILKLFSYTFTFRHLSFFLSVAFSLEGDHLDPKIHSTPSRNLEGNQLISSIPRALLGGTWHLWWGFFLFSIGPAQGYFLSCFLQAVCLFFIFFPPLDPSYSLMIITTSLFQIHNSIPQPQLSEKWVFFTCSAEAVQVF